MSYIHVFTHEVLALGTVVLVIKVKKFTLMLLNKIQYAEEVPVPVPALAFRLFRASWDGMVNRLIM